MIVYFLKFSACLAIFLVFYKLVLERENMHTFKRYFLLSALLLSLGIPLITFYEYVEPVVLTQTLVLPTEQFIDQSIVEEAPESVTYLPIVLWSLYGLGVLFFGIKFLYNLFQIISKIKGHPQLKNKPLIYVLMDDLVVPHTFFNYIFLNRLKFETEAIPKEVFWHEQAHASQKHSLDVLFIELLQVIFWFNPLIYFAKASIKMNHEFLADEAVLEHGIEPSLYQQLLLTFSSNVTEPNLANAINYSSIRLKVLGKEIFLFNTFVQVKKRFTVMKTHTSKQKIWLRSFLLLPLVALTLYGFSETKEVEQPLSHEEVFLDSIDLYLNEKGELLLLLENKIITIEAIEKLQKENNKLQVSIQVFPDVDPEIAKTTIKKIKDIGIKKMSYYTSGSTANQNPDEVRLEVLDSLKELKNQHKATPEEVAEYNKLAKHYNTQSEDHQVFRIKDMKRLREIYDKMSKEQKANAEPLPNFPPPPPPPPAIPANATPEQIKNYKIKTSTSDNESYTYQQTTKEGKVVEIVVIPDDEGMVPPPPPPTPATSNKNETMVKTGFIIADGETLYFVENGSKKTYYNRSGNVVDKNGKKLNGDVQVNASDVIPGQHITKVYKNDRVVAEFKNDRPKLANGNVPAPPPPPKSRLEHVIEMAKKDATFYYGNKVISSEDAIQLIRTNSELKIQTTQVDSKEPKVYMSKKPINVKPQTNSSELVMVNGKKLDDGVIEMTIEELKNARFSFEKSKVDTFKFKIPGVKTESVSGDQLSSTAKTLLETMKAGSAVQLFLIKDSNNSVHPPLLITIKE